MSISLSLQKQLIAKFEAGAGAGGTTLNQSECENMLFLLRSSVPLEPFLELFTQITRATIIGPTRVRGNRHEENKKSI